GPRGVLTAAVRQPGAVVELQAAVVAVAGVDVPVAARLTAGDPGPIHARAARRRDLAGVGGARARTGRTRTGRAGGRGLRRGDVGADVGDRRQRLGDGLAQDLLRLTLDAVDHLDLVGDLLRTLLPVL